MKDIVLLVDDEPSILKSLNRILEADDRIILTAEDGKQALESIKRNPVDLILTDYRMPVMDGLDLLYEIKLIDPSIVCFVQRCSRS